MSEQPPRRASAAGGPWRRRYRRAAVVTTAGVVFLTVAGGVVRLTDSGLGCADWPACNDERFIDVSSTHAAIEQLNRLASGLIGLPTLLLLIAAFRPTGRAGLRWPAVGTFIAVIVNAVVGGIAVQRDLHPALVQSHFLLAMVAVVFGMIAVMRSAGTPLSPHLRGGRLARVVGLLTAFTAATLATGTIVTGTGPHAGDETARRFGFDISNVARTHSVTVLVTLAVALWFAWLLQRQAGSTAPVLRNATSSWLFVGALQGAIGYAQYFNGVPELLVGIHIALAAALWVMTMRLLVLVLTPPVDVAVAADPVRAVGDDAPKHRFLGAGTSHV